MLTAVARAEDTDRTMVRPWRQWVHEPIRMKSRDYHSESDYNDSLVLVALR